jgi:adenylate cyclase
VTGPDPESVVEWVRSVPTIRGPDSFLDELCGRLCAVGLPLYRVAVFIQTLHPNVMGRRFMWKQGEGVTMLSAPLEVQESAEFKDSPIYAVLSRNRAMRRNLTSPGHADDYVILSDLRAEGVTDYLIHPLPFTNGEIHAVSWTTCDAEGFTEAHVGVLEAIRLAFARLVEIYVLRRTALTLLNTYVGHVAGERILAGRIHRGDTEAIRAVIWLSDLRGFTALADEMPADALVAVLNQHFDCMVPAIEGHGGEVLKFMGDGLLAIFPLGEGNTGEICRAAIAAALDARANMEAFNEARRDTDLAALRFGLALHLGEIQFGNIGAARRLDFTVIGPGVNLAARLEKIAGDLGRDVVMSANFAAHCRDDAEPLGNFPVRGFRDEVEVFGLRPISTPGPA